MSPSVATTSGLYGPYPRGTEEDATLLNRIRSIHQHSYGTYGAPRIHAELKRVRYPRRVKTRGSPDAHGLYQRGIATQIRAHYKAIEDR